jgi:hypothetical protein
MATISEYLPLRSFKNSSLDWLVKGCRHATKQRNGHLAMGVLVTSASMPLSTYHNLGISGTENLLGILGRPDEVLLDVSCRQKGKTSVS